MRSLLKGLVYTAVGLALLVPVGLTLAAVGIPLMVIGGVAVAVMAVAAVAIALPVIVVAAVMVGLVGAIFGLLVMSIGLGIVALKLTLLVVAVLFGLQFVGRLLVGKPRRRVPIGAAPVRDRYEQEAERELDRELQL